jgi:hypothetical protein
MRKRALFEDRMVSRFAAVERAARLNAGEAIEAQVRVRTAYVRQGASRCLPPGFPSRPILRLIEFAFRGYSTLA